MRKHYANASYETLKWSRKIMKQKYYAVYEIGFFVGKLIYAMRKLCIYLITAFIQQRY